MKEKIYFYCIIKTLASFGVFYLTGQLIGILLRMTSAFGDSVIDILRFVVSASLAIIVFLHYNSLLPPPEGYPETVRTPKLPFSPRRLFSTILQTVACVALLIVVMYVVALSFVPEFDTDPSLVPSPLTFFTLVLLHPIVEEYLFRHLYYRELCMMGPIFACLMQGVMFAISHNSIGSMMYALVAGVLLGAAAGRTHGIAVPTAAHFLINLRTFLFEHAVAAESQTVIDSTVVTFGLISAVILLLLLRHEPKDSAKKANGAPQSLREEVEFDD